MAIPVLGGIVRLIDRIPVPLTKKRLGLATLVRETAEDVGEDHLGAFAGSLTYSIVFAVVPFFAFLVALLGLFGSDALFDQILGIARNALPVATHNFITSIVTAVRNAPRAEFGLGALLTILVSLYGVSGAFRAIMEALNVMYGVKEERPFWRVYLTSALLAVGVVALLVGAVVLVVFGPDLGASLASLFGLREAFLQVWAVVATWIVPILVVLLAFALVYYYAPNVEQSFKFLTPGSLLAVILWFAFTQLFGTYVSRINLGPWGGAANVVVLMLYIYYSSFILLLGAEINQVIEEYSPEGKDKGEKTTPAIEAEKARA